MFPLPDSVSVLLRTSPTAAMAALLLISTAHRGLLDWFSRTVCGAPDLEPPPKPRAGGGRLPRAGKAPKRSNGDGHGEPRGVDHRTVKRDADDDALVAAMRADPVGTIGDWAGAIDKSKSSVVSALARLRDAGLVVNADRRWRLTDDPAPRDPPPAWVSPLKGRDRSAQAHLTAAS